MSKPPRPAAQPNALVHSPITAEVGAALDPHQRKFNRLLQQIDKARTGLADWDREAALFGTAYEQLVRPVRREVCQAQVEIVARLDQLVGTKGWTRAERETLVEELCGLSAYLSEAADLSPEQRARCLALHDRHAPQTFEAAQREALDDLRQAFTDITGLDLGDDEISSPEELFKRTHERMSEAQAAQQQAEPPARPRKQSKAAAARAAREQADAEAASQSVREVFRKLAATLHPDRATDDADRATRTERMQRANQAYAAGDLLALLSLQLEVEQVDAAHIARVTSERARQLNGLLDEQLRELRQGLQERQFAFADGYGISNPHRLSAKTLGAMLKSLRNQALAEQAAQQSQLRMLGGDKPAIKAWLRELREDARADAMMDDLLFDLMRSNPPRRR